MIISFNATTKANQYEGRIYFNKYFIEIDQSSWINQSTPILIGININNFSIAYGLLYSDIFTSYGDRLKLEYLYKLNKISPGFGLSIDHYRRSDQGGITGFIKLDYKIYKQLDLQIGISRGWLNDFTPYISLNMEVF
jgi:hypothetical protein